MDSRAFPSRVAAATDFSEAAAQAVRRAAMLAAEHGTPLEVVHVVRDDALAQLRWIASPAELGGKLCVPARESLEALAASVAAPLRDLLLGSTAERLLARVRGPILVVKAAPAGAYRKVLVALDLGEGSGRVLEAASRIAPAAALTVAHAYDVPFEGMLHRAGVGAADIDRHRGEALRRALEQIEGLARAAAIAPHRLAPIADRGHPAKLIVDHVATHAPDLVVLGRRPRSVAERILLGSVARHVVAGAACDVLVVPQPAAADA